MSETSPPSRRSPPSTLPSVPAVHPPVHPPVCQETKKKMMNRLQELEKQLLDDDDVVEAELEEGQSDAVSVITNANNEWSETIQNLITPSSSPNDNINNNNSAGHNQISLSPSPSSSSSSSTTTAATTTAAPALAICSREVLLEAATAIYDGKTESTAEILSRLTKSLANGKGNSEQRLMDCLFAALKSKVNPAENPPLIRQGSRRVDSAAFRALSLLQAQFHGYQSRDFRICSAK
ncbi:Scarecrow-like protein 8 [Linum grandiflorum]